MAVATTLIAEPNVGFDFTVVGLDRLRAAISAVGELDLAARDALVDVLTEQIEAGHRFIHLDLSGVTFMDCSCLGALMASHQQLRARRGLLVISGVSAPIARVLKLSGHDLLFVVPADHHPFGRVPTPRAPS